MTVAVAVSVSVSVSVSVAVSVAVAVSTTHHVVTNFRQLIIRQQVQVIGNPGSRCLINGQAGTTQPLQGTTANTANNNRIN